LILGGSY